MLQTLSILSLSLVLLVACGKDESKPAPPPPGPAAPDKPAPTQPTNLKPEAASWRVVSRKCGDVELPLFGNEKLQFEAELFTWHFVASATSDQICNEARVFGRYVLKETPATDSYEEASYLQVAEGRVVCLDRVSGKILKKDTTQYSARRQNLALKVDARGGVAMIDGLRECPGGALRFELVRE